MEELKDIEPYAYEVIYSDGDGELFYMQHLAKERAVEVEGEVRGLHTAEQMQEYAEAKCGELINWFVEMTGDINYAPEMKIWIDDEFKEAQDEEVHR